jgi:hypothetical protein
VAAFLVEVCLAKVAPMKFESKYKVGDKLLVKGSALEIERVLTVTDIQIRTTKEENEYVVWYGFKESLWMHSEGQIEKEVRL